MYKVKLPDSKSILIRLLFLSSGMDKDLLVRSYSESEDVRTVRTALEKLGCNYEIFNNELKVKSPVKLSDRAELYIKDSAAGLRFMLALLAFKAGGKYLLNASEQLRNRPLKPLIEALKESGAVIDDRQYPIKISGSKTCRKEVFLNPSISSQYTSALLIAAAVMEESIRIKFTGQRVSSGYEKMTIRMLERFGIQVVQGHKELFIPSGKQLSSPVEYMAEPDYSSAAYFMAMAASGGKAVEIDGNRSESLQPDARFADILEEMGAKVFDNSDSCEVRTGELKGIELDMNEMPDQVLTLGVLGLLTESGVVMSGIEHLKYKESNRIDAFISQVKLLGGDVEYYNGVLKVQPLRKPPDPVRIETFYDHRMAMAFSILQSRYPFLEINNKAVVEKSFPNFWEELIKYTKQE